MSNFYYFAYGSNLLNARLKNRCASAKPVGIASVQGFDINYGMVAKDKHGGSGKMAMFATDNGADEVFGVVYELDMADAPVLDGFEGLGRKYFMNYTRAADFDVKLTTGEKLQTVTYLVDPHDEPPLPYHWYWALCLSGAIENNLPKHHQDKLRAHGYMPDPHEAREGKTEAEMLLRKSGFGHLIDTPPK